MKSNYTKEIESYLANELSASEKIKFEQELLQNDSLLQEFTLQQQIHRAAERAIIRKEVRSVGKSYHLFRKAKISIVVLLGILAVFIGSTVIRNSKNNKEEKFSELNNVKAPVKDIKGSLLLHKAASEIFHWEGNDSIFLSKRSVLISVPKNAFLLYGKTFRNKAVITWEEALDAPTIMKNGLSTMTNGKLLETQGMIHINAYTEEGKKLSINPKVGVYIQVPVDEYKDGMKLYKGVTNREGVINWVNPKPLQKALLPVDMKILNFYPEGYEAKLDELKLPTSKSYRDSLYLSFDKTKTKKMEEVEETVVPFEQYDAENLFKNKCSSCHSVFKNGVGPNLYRVRGLWKGGGAKDSSIYQWVNNWQEAAESDPYAATRTTYSTTAMKQFPELSQEQIDAIFDFIDSSPITTTRINQKKYHSKDKLKTTNEERTPEGWDDKIKWSFSVKYGSDGDATIIAKAKLIEGWNLFSMQHDRNKVNGFGYPTKISVRTGIDFRLNGTPYELEEPILLKHKRGNFLGYSNEAVFAQKIKIKSTQPFYLTGSYKFKICNDKLSLFPPDQQFTIKIKGTIDPKTDDNSNLHKKIPPSEILAFWKPEFNNTLLATREFERRMKEIHTTGDQKLLNIYTYNLESTMEQLDKKAVDLGYPQFQKFVNEHIGGISTSKAHIKILQKFYQKSINEFREALAKNNVLKEKIQNEWDKKYKRAKEADHIRIKKSKEEAVQEEYLLNVNAIGKQLGLKEENTKHLGKSIGFQVIEFGFYNIDRLVNNTPIVEQKANNEDFVAFQMEVENANQYNLLFAYLLPSKLNSYERILGRKGKFEYPLSNTMHYNVAVIGINGTEFFYSEATTSNRDELIHISLEQITEIDLNKKIQQLNLKRGVKAPYSFSEEIEWLVIELKNYIVQKQRRDEKAFRDMLHDIIFPSDKKRNLKK